MHIYNHASLVVQYMYTFTCAFTASQMMTLVRRLPLFIGDLVDHDDDHWECFLLLWDICSVVCSFEVTIDDATHLGWLIETYLEAFTSLYGTSVTPKMHYLVHLPKQIYTDVSFYFIE